MSSSFGSFHFACVLYKPLRGCNLFFNVFLVMSLTSLLQTSFPIHVPINISRVYDALNSLFSVSTKSGEGQQTPLLHIWKRALKLKLVPFGTAPIFLKFFFNYNALSTSAAQPDLFKNFLIKLYGKCFSAIANPCISR